VVVFVFWVFVGVLLGGVGGGGGGGGGEGNKEIVRSGQPTVNQ